MSVKILEESSIKRKFRVLNNLEDKLDVEEFIFANDKIILKEMSKKNNYVVKCWLGITERKGGIYRDNYISYTSFSITCKEEKINFFSTLYDHYRSALYNPLSKWKLVSINCLIIEQTNL